MVAIPGTTKRVGNYFMPVRSRAGIKFSEEYTSRIAQRDLTSAKFNISSTLDYDNAEQSLLRINNYLKELGAFKDGELLYKRQDTELGKFISDYVDTVKQYFSNSLTKNSDSDLERLIA